MKRRVKRLPLRLPLALVVDDLRVVQERHEHDASDDVAEHGRREEVAEVGEEADLPLRHEVEHLDGAGDRVVEVAEPEGAFYVFPSFAGVMGRSLAGTTVSSTLQLADVLLEEVQVALVPGEAFGAPAHARLSYALGDADLEEGITRIATLLAAG